MKTAVSLFHAAASACLLAAPLAAQSPRDPTLQSQREAVGVVSRAIAAHGGHARIRALGPVAMRMRVAGHQAGQEVNPDSMAAPGGTTFRTFITDVSRGADVVEIFPRDTSSRPSGRLVRTSSDRFFYRAANNTVQELDVAAVRGFLLGGVPYVPATLLAVWDRAETLRSLGRQRIAGTAHDVVTWADEGGNQVSLFFDARTALLARTEVVAPNEPFGLGVQEVVYSDYRAEGDLTLPHSVTVRLGGRAQAEGTVLSVDLAARLDSSTLRRPEGATVAPVPPAATPAAVRSLTVDRIAAGVYVLRDVIQGYHAMFVEEADHVIVIEAEGDQVASESVLRTVRETIPDKPVRYLVLTHHHFDHSGGLWTFMANGIIVVTTPGNEAFVRSVAAAPHTRDGRVAAVPTPTIETVTGRRVYGSGAGTIELHDVGPNPHADHILVAYLPSARLLFVPDVYGWSPGVNVPNLLVPFADRLATLSLDIDTFVTAHTDPSTWAEYEVAVAQARTRLQAAPR